MLHLAVNKDFTYLNYISIMSAIINNEVTVWIVDEEPSNKYWSIVKKVPSIIFKTTTREKGITASYLDKIGRTDILYLGELNDNYVEDSKMDHPGLYEENGEFEDKDMCLIKIRRPEMVTLEHIKENKTLLAELVRRLLREGIWNV